MNSFLDTAACYIERAGLLRHRALFVCAGDPVASRQQGIQLLDLALSCGLPDGESTHGAPSLWVGQLAPPNTRQLNPAAARSELGSEFWAVVIDTTTHGFDCEAFAALSGTIRAGGALILIVPPLEQWPTNPDQERERIAAYSVAPPPASSHYLQRLASALTTATRPLVPASSSIPRVLGPSLATTFASHSANTDEAVYGEQRHLAAGIYDHIAHPERRVMLITADRGRGKSAALGIAAARWLDATSGSHSPRIIVTAPGKRAVNILYEHCRRVVSDEKLLNRLVFCPPDQLTEIANDEILFVDEAASIPLPQLLHFAETFRQTVFASTVQGYEGAGRGFALRFTALLRPRSVSYSQHTLQTPIRWSPDDPLEAFINSAMMLDADLPEIRSSDRSTPPPHQLSEFTPDKMLADDALLRDVFGLLTQAHYRTSPLDLRHMLDSTNLRCYLLWQGDAMVGASLIATEGPITDPLLRDGIIKRERRPNGHLLPQLMAQFSISSAALDLKIARIVRIAIHPELQRLTLGSQFVDRLKTELHTTGFDGIGATFAAVPDTLRFWITNHFQPWHLGFREHASSGYPAISVMKLSNDCFAHEFERARKFYLDRLAFKAQTNDPLISTLIKLDPAADVANTAIAGETPNVELMDMFVLQQYCRGARSFTDSHAAIARTARVLLSRASVKEPLTSQSQQLLEHCQLPDITRNELAHHCGFDGKKNMEKQLRDTLDELTFNCQSASQL